MSEKQNEKNEETSAQEWLWWGPQIDPNDHTKAIRARLMIDLRDVPAIRECGNWEVAEVLLNGSFLSIGIRFEELQKQWLRAHTFKGKGPRR